MDMDLEKLQTWFFDHGITIVGIIVAVIIINAFAKYFIERGVRKLIKSSPGVDQEAERKREDTLIKVLDGLVRVLSWVVGFMMVISEFGIDIGPLLAAAGVAGVAIGFGGQYLIRDIVSGLFIILENQYRVGDIVCVGDKCGMVEGLNLRLTVLRDLDGVVHHIPNGEVAVASNMTKEYSRVNFNIGISYDSDLEKVIELVNKIGKEMSEDEKWKDSIIKAPEFLRVDDFADSSIIIKILGDTVPAQQWAVLGELRKRIKIAFDKEGIEIPFPQRVIHQK